MNFYLASLDTLAFLLLLLIFKAPCHGSQYFSDSHILTVYSDRSHALHGATNGSPIRQPGSPIPVEHEICR
ncbi:hypothetical protein BDV95DRAFT_583993 [Massariosphaeria phaeospora]|uniref:Secreted protein n=1 Tax=Massariosphaeria phaeospora TaxID=100035 RepID=A0A7C8I2S0_9PLEO|nr:hypothetical protein BDV95DRAFT_583993 [Massariosphaeria phaeospora]